MADPQTDEGGGDRDKKKESHTHNTTAPSRRQSSSAKGMSFVLQLVNGVILIHFFFSSCACVSVFLVSMDDTLFPIAFVARYAAPSHRVWGGAARSCPLLVLLSAPQYPQTSLCPPPPPCTFAGQDTLSFLAPHPTLTPTLCESLLTAVKCGTRAWNHTPSQNHRSHEQ